MQWLTNGVKFLSGYKMYLLAGVAAVGLYGSGYLVGSRNEARIQIKEVEKRVMVPVVEYKEVQVRNVQRERDLAAQLAVSQKLVMDQRTRLNALPVNSCPISGDVVGLLNEAITGHDVPAHPTGIPTGSADSITATALTSWALDAIAQYNDVSTRYNGLIDWVEEELIQPDQ